MAGRRWVQFRAGPESGRCSQFTGLLQLAAVVAAAAAAAEAFLVLASAPARPSRSFACWPALVSQWPFRALRLLRAFDSIEVGRALSSSDGLWWDLGAELGGRRLARRF